MKEQLYPHNQQAYEKVMKAFETSNRTCIIHPTGTGKSYIVAAVCKHFQKVLILAPNIFVLEQQKNSLNYHKDVTYMTYPGLLSMVFDLEEKYDLIVLDEFHRAGADEWGAAVLLLLDSQPQAKILGTSATPIRYLDGTRDMSKEIFYSNIASEISIAKAWNMNILPIPTYVIGLYSFDKVIEEGITRINNAKKLSIEEKELKTIHLSNLKFDWEKSNGMVPILKKHLRDNSHRIIVFCSRIEHLKEIQNLTKQWFSQAGFPISRVYTLHSKQSDREQLLQMKRFSSDISSGIKLMLTINVLNEGVHIPNVDAVIMLRSTISRNIYLQQLGRCLTANNSDTPLILDMVDNITTTDIIRSAAYEFRRSECSKEDSGEKILRRFEIYDYVLSVQQMVEKLAPRRKYTKASLEEHLTALELFCKEHNCLPVYKHYGEYNNHYQWLSNNCPDHPDFLKLKELYKFKVLSIDERLERLNLFISKYNRLPVKEEKEDYLNWAAIRNYRLVHGDKRIDAIWDEYCRQKDDALIKRKLLKFVVKNKRLPSGKSSAPKEELYLRAAVVQRKLHQTDPEIAKIWKDYKAPIRRTFEEKIVNMQEFTKLHGRRPRQKEPEHQQWDSIIFHCKEDERVKEMVRKYGNMRSKEIELKESIQEIMEFFEKNGHFPSNSPNSPSHKLGHKMYSIVRNHSDNPFVQEFIKFKKEQQHQRNKQ